MAPINTGIQKSLSAVRDELDRQGKRLTPPEWKELLEELSADIEGHLDAIEEEESWEGR